jgi:hypothetical protein
MRSWFLVARCRVPAKLTATLHWAPPSPRARMSGRNGEWARRRVGEGANGKTGKTENQHHDRKCGESAHHATRVRSKL